MTATRALLHDTPRLSRYDATRWVLACPGGHQLLLTADSADLIRLAATAPTPTASHQAFSERFGTSLTLEEFTQLLQQTFGGYGLLRDDPSPTRPQPPVPFHAHWELVPGRWAARMAAPLRGFYAPGLFWPLLAGSTAVLVGLHYLVPVPALTASESGWAVAALYGSVLVHELGHIAACRRAGLPTGSIGVGLYYGFPLVYADVTGLWGGTRHQRLIGNLGGIYSQLVLAAAAAGIGYLTGSNSWHGAAELIGLSAAWQLNPFVRHDGYWVLSDLTRTPNLQQQAAQVRSHVLSIRELTKGRLRRLPRQQWGLLGYGVANTGLVVFILFYGLWRTLPVLPQLPTSYAALWAQLLHGPLSMHTLALAHLPVLAFYGWLGRTAWLRLRQRSPAQ